MRTSFNAVDILYKRGQETAFKASLSLTGGQYKKARPKDSETEDVVYNSLGLPNTDIQRGILNINIHVPNLKVLIGGREDNTLPNTARLQQLTTLYVKQFDDVFADDVWFYIQQDNLLQDTDGRWYSNIRVMLNAVNTEGHEPSVFNPASPGSTETDPVYESEKGDLVRSVNNEW